jgi:hypothetical protein
VEFNGCQLIDADFLSVVTKQENKILLDRLETADNVSLRFERKKLESSRAKLLNGTSVLVMSFEKIDICRKKEDGDSCGRGNF